MRTADEIRAELDSVEDAANHLRAELLGAIAAEKETAIGNGLSNLHGYWRPDGSCSYCGSMTVGEAILRLKTAGTRYSGADWKYGWPHKFYIEAGGYPHKFYNEHLDRATPEEFEEFAKLSKALLAIEWVRDEKGVGWKATPGTQRDGVVA